MKFDIKHMALRAATLSGKDIDVPRAWLEEYTTLVLDEVSRRIRMSSMYEETIEEVIELIDSLEP